MVNWNQFQNATDPSNKPTPGWLFNELIKDVKSSPKDVPDVAEYLMQCVCSDQLNIQLKGVLCIKHIASEEVTFQNYMQMCPGALKVLEDLAAPPIVPQARALEPQDVRTVRDATKQALEAIRTPHTVEKQTAGADLKARCQGFGNYEPPQEEVPKKQGVAGQAAEFVVDSIGDMVDDFREKGAVGALKDATVDALDLVLDGVDTIWSWVAGPKNVEAQRICQPTNQFQQPGQFGAQAPIAGFTPPAAAPRNASNAYAAAFGGGVVGANNPVQVGGMAPTAAPSAYSAYSTPYPTPAPAPAAKEEPPKPAPAPMFDLLSMDEPAAAQPATTQNQQVSDLLSMDEPAAAAKPQVQTTNMLDF